MLLAENLLGILEAALAIAKWENLAFIQDRFELRIDASSTGHNPPEIGVLSPPAQGEFYLDCGWDLFQWLSGGPRKDVFDWLRHFLFFALITLTIDPIEELRAELDEWHEAGTFNRALAFSPTAVLQNNLIGGNWHDPTRWPKTTATPEV